MFYLKHLKEASFLSFQIDLLSSSHMDLWDTHGIQSQSLNDSSVSYMFKFFSGLSSLLSTNYLKVGIGEGYCLHICHLKIPHVLGTLGILVSH